MPALRRTIARCTSLFLLALAACAGGDGGGGGLVDPGAGGGGGGGGTNVDCAAANTICAQATAFSKTALTIKAGEKVRWEYVSGGAHDVTSENNVWTAVPLDPTNRVFERTFNAPGTYRYRCTFHSQGYASGQGMNGVITVAP